MTVNPDLILATLRNLHENTDQIRKTQDPRAHHNDTIANLHVGNLDERDPSIMFRLEDSDDAPDLSAHEKMEIRALERRIHDDLRSLKAEFRRVPILDDKYMSFTVSIRLLNEQRALAIHFRGLRLALEGSPSILGVTKRLCDALENLNKVSPEILDGRFEEYLINRDDRVWAPSAEAAMKIAEVVGGLRVNFIHRQINTQATRMALLESSSDPADHKKLNSLKSAIERRANRKIRQAA